MMKYFVLFLLFLRRSSSSTDRNTIASNLSSSSPRVAICFFGLTRSLQYTKHNLHSHIFDVLKQHEIAYDVYVHTYNITQLTNPRSKEKAVSLDPNAWKHLYPSRYAIDSNEYVERTVIKKYLPLFLAPGDPFNERAPHLSLRNLIKQFYSLQSVTELWTKQTQQQIKKYDAVLYLRPDIWYFNDLNITHLRLVMGQAAPSSSPSSHIIFVPNFHSWRGVNDRFAFGSPSVMQVYGRRLLGVANYSRAKPVHPETYLADHLSANHITPRNTTILFERVRANGLLWGIPINGEIPTFASKRYQLVRNELGEWSSVPVPLF